MFMALHKRLRNRDEGFTLIELMVVVLIIAILIAIAVPTFLGARKKAQDRAAQANIRNAFTAEKTFYTDTEAYSVDVATGGDLVSIEPSLTWAAGTGPPTVTTGNTVLVAGLGTVDANGDYPTIVVMAKSASGTCFYLKDDAASATQYAKDTGCTMTSATFAAGSW